MVIVIELFLSVLDLDRWIVEELECTHADWCKDFYSSCTEELMPVGFRTFQEGNPILSMSHLTAASYKYVSCVSLCFWTVQTISERLIQMGRFEPFARICGPQFQEWNYWTLKGSGIVYMYIISYILIPIYFCYCLFVSASQVLKTPDSDA